MWASSIVTDKLHLRNIFFPHKLWGKFISCLKICTVALKCKGGILGVGFAVVEHTDHNVANAILLRILKLRHSEMREGRAAISFLNLPFGVAFFTFMCFLIKKFWRNEVGSLIFDRVGPALGAMLVSSQGCSGGMINLLSFSTERYAFRHRDAATGGTALPNRLQPWFLQRHAISAYIIDEDRSQRGWSSSLSLLH